MQIQDLDEIGTSIYRHTTKLVSKLFHPSDDENEVFKKGGGCTNSKSTVLE